MRIKFRFISVLAAVALLLGAPALADTVIRFHDAGGNRLTDVAMTAVYGAGISERHIAGPDGSFIIGAGPGDKVEIRVRGTDGRQYETIQAVVPSDVGGSWDLTVTPMGNGTAPENDFCLDATPAAVPGITEGTTIDATRDNGEVISGGLVGSVFGKTCGDVTVQSQGTWHTVVGNGNTITVSTCANVDLDGDGNTGEAPFDSRLTVWCGSCYDNIGGPRCVAGNDDADECGFPDEDAVVSFCGQPGAEYLIHVSGFGTLGSDDAGDYKVEIVEGEPCEPLPGDTGLYCDLPGPVCGNGVPEPGEECDDGNTENGDFCDEFCNIEPPGACCQCLCAFIPPTGDLNFDCDVTNQFACENFLGGTFLGDGTICLAEGLDVVLVNTPELAIPDGIDAEVPGAAVSDTITVSESFLLFDVDVDVVLSHSWHGDLVISVTSPSGTSVPLWNRFCDFQGSVGIDTIFDGDSTTTQATPDACAGGAGTSPLGGGTFLPAGDLGAFQGEDAAGDWTITLRDWFDGDTGTLQAWSLHLNRAVLPCPSEACPALQPATPGDGEDDAEADSAIEAEGSTDEGLVDFGFSGHQTENQTAQPTSGEDVEDEEQAPARDRKAKSKKR